MTSATDPSDATAASGAAAAAAAAADRNRPVVPVRDDSPLIPERSADDSDAGWNEGSDSNDERLWRDVPPHWSPTHW